MKEPKDDQTSLGSILLDWGIVTKEQLEKALKEQKILRGDALLGKLLVADGSCTPEEINIAMSAQAGMRKGDYTKQALAVADLAIERQRRKSVIERRDRVIRAGERLRRSITGEDHPAITVSMLAKPSSD
jgi:hypothetical protein